ncbi:unnamed protein product, partial [marine sediment metagenome]
TLFHRITDSVHKSGHSRGAKVKLSVALPTLNEEKAIEKVIQDIRLHTPDFDTEIVICDSSTDRTPRIAAEMGAVVIKQPPRGHGKALLAAMQAATGDLIATADCDNTYPMEMIPKMVKLMADEGLDIISANRMKSARDTMPLSNQMANHAFALLVRLLYGIPTSDVSTGMFLMKRDLVKSIQWETNLSFPAELIIRSRLAGFKWRQVNIDYRPRVGEVTLSRWKSGKAYLRCIFKYRFTSGNSKICSKKYKRYVI